MAETTSATVVRLSPLDRKRLMKIARSREATMSETIRQLIREKSKEESK